MHILIFLKSLYLSIMLYMYLTYCESKLKAERCKALDILFINEYKRC